MLISILFLGYRNGPEERNPYDLSPQYWHVFAARLAFVVVFEHLVFAITGIMQYAIPDVPSAVSINWKKKAFVEILYNYAFILVKDSNAT